ncbi:MAG: hypothetical protein C0405_04735 [Desulfovibrio sp.]|nr:hypothetical protein [Desulfovibrio sp.]
MAETLTLVLQADPKALLALTPLLREGVGAQVRPGLSLRRTLVEDLGLDPVCVEERVQTVFLDGSPVDDIDADCANPGCTLALAAALPGVAGIAMRRGSPVGVFREGIAHGVPHDVDAGRTGSGEELAVTLKLFNSVAVECLAPVLGRGITLRARRLAELLTADPDALATASFSLDGQAMDRAGLVAALQGSNGQLRVQAVP